MNFVRFCFRCSTKNCTVILLRTVSRLINRPGNRNVAFNKCDCAATVQWIFIRNLNSLYRFNVAEIGAMSRDIPYEAKILVKRMRSDPNVDLHQHWKIVTILIGPNDFCSDFCYQAYPERSAENHRKELIETLRILRDNLPRTIVNVVTPPSKLATSC